MATSKAKAAAAAKKAAAAKVEAARKKAAQIAHATVKPENLPGDYLKGSKLKGKKYTAFKTKSGARPDLGAGSAGPGQPYREVQKTMMPKKPGAPWKTPTTSRPFDAKQGAVWRRWNNPNTAPTSGSPGRQFGNPDAKTKAIARRLNNG